MEPKNPVAYLNLCLCNMNRLRLYSSVLGFNIQIFFLPAALFFSPAAPYLLHTMMGAQQNAASSTTRSSPHLNAGGCSNGIYTMLPSPERYCVRIPEATVKGKRLACHPLPLPEITHPLEVLDPKKDCQTPVSFRSKLVPGHVLGTIYGT